MKKFEEEFEYDPYDFDVSDRFYKTRQSEEDTFYALTDGQYGSFDDFQDNSGDLDELKDYLGY